MQSDNMQYQLDYMINITQNSYQCLVCLEQICTDSKQTFQLLLIEHFLSKKHLTSQFQILIKLGFIEGSANDGNLEAKQHLKQKKLFNLSKAKELKKLSLESLNCYFEWCSQKKINTQKTYLIILKCFYYFIFYLEQDFIEDDCILQFLSKEGFKQIAYRLQYCFQKLFVILYLQNYQKIFRNIRSNNKQYVLKRQKKYINIANNLYYCFTVTLKKDKHQRYFYYFSQRLILTISQNENLRIL